MWVIAVSEEFDYRGPIREADALVLPTLPASTLPQSSWCAHFQSAENLHENTRGSLDGGFLHSTLSKSPGWMPQNQHLQQVLQV